MIETFHIFVETAKTLGVDHIASTFIVIQLGVVGFGASAHTVAHVTVYVFRRFRKVSPPPLVRHVRVVQPGVVTRRYVPIHRPRP